jgi:hypothetical protein
MTSRAVLQWTMETGIDWHYIAPGKPTLFPVSAHRTD